MSENPNALNFACDWQFGFNFDPEQKGTVGYLMDWSGCSGLNLKKDITVWNPYDAEGQTVVKGSNIKCIGLLESFEYNGGDNDPIRIKAYVSKGSAGNIRSTISKPLKNTKIKVGWYIISYDEDVKLWYEGAYIKSPKKADANINSADGAMQIFVQNIPTKISETLDINVYLFEFQVVPADKKKASLYFATGPKTKIIKNWAG